MNVLPVLQCCEDPWWLQCQCVVASRQQRSDLQPRNVTRLGTETVTLWFTGQRSIHWATPVKAYNVKTGDFSNFLLSCVRSLCNLYFNCTMDPPYLSQPLNCSNSKISKLGNPFHTPTILFPSLSQIQLSLHNLPGTSYVQEMWQWSGLENSLSSKFTC